MSFKIKKREDERFVILAPNSDRVIDDAWGYGYRTTATAYAGFTHFKVKRWQKYRRELRKHEREETSSNTHIKGSL